jgi:hypothetical protein
VVELQFTSLERSALAEICRRQVHGREALESQLATAAVTRRKNSGVGFFTYLTVDPSTPPVATAARVLGEVWASIEGFKQPFVLLLFMKDGYAEFLEGASIDDSTVGIDLSTIQFKIIQD